ncbi:MAG TPA: hypothetical protein VJM33_12345, partial [Microthrixaceae bacterium]|nr:hypothetical protein [Microthrixaceae bacterium]
MAERTTKASPTNSLEQPPRPGSRDALDQLLRSRRSRRDRPPGPLTWLRSVEIDRRLVVGGAVLVAAVVVAWWLIRPSSPPVESRLPVVTAPANDGEPGGSARSAATDDASHAPTSSVVGVDSGPLVVHVAGAVARPGIV